MSSLPLPPVRMEIRPSRLLPGQIGVFATRRLERHAIVVEAAQFQIVRLIPWSDFDRFDAITQAKIMDYCAGTEAGFFAPPDLNNLPIGWHLNHCCAPNVGLDEVGNFIAMRRIEPGEELCWDYAFDESNPAFRMACTCGAPGCRGVVTGNDWRILARDPAVWPYLSADIRRLAVAAGIRPA